MTEPTMSSGQNDVVSDTVEPKAGEKIDTVAYETHQKLLGERKRDQARIRELAEKTAAFEKAEREREEKTLLERNQFQDVLKIRDKEVEEYKTKYTQLLDYQVNTAKQVAFLENVDGKIPQKYWGMIPRDEIQMDQDSGEIDKNSLKAAIDKFKREYPEVILPSAGTRQAAPSPTSANVKQTRDDMMKQFTSILK